MNYQLDMREVIEGAMQTQYLRIGGKPTIQKGQMIYHMDMERAMIRVITMVKNINQ